MFYFLYGENVSLSEIREIAVSAIGCSAKNMLPAELITKLGEHGYDVKTLHIRGV